MLQREPFLILPEPWAWLLVRAACSVRMPEGMPWQGRGVTCFVAAAAEMLPAEELRAVRKWARLDLPMRDEFVPGAVHGWATFDVIEGRAPAGSPPAYGPGAWGVLPTGDGQLYQAGSWTLPSPPAVGWHRLFAVPPQQPVQLSLL